MALDRILLVDDEPNVLDGYRRTLRGQFEICTAQSGAAALEMIEREAAFAVVVSDMRMPGMSGVEFLKRVKAVTPDSVRMMLTGNADQETAIQAVNLGHIFRFLSKPCTPQSLSIALSMGVRQYRLVTAEKELLEKTLNGSVQILTQILSLTDPNAFAAADKVKRYLSLSAQELGIQNQWALEAAVMLSPIGFLTLPQELKSKVIAGGTLSTKEEQALLAVPEISARLLANIPRLEEAAELVRLGVDKTRLDISTGGKLSDGAVFGLDVLRLLFDLVQAEQGGIGVERALEELKHRARHDADLVDKVRVALQHSDPSLFSGEYVVLEVPLKKVLIGDELFGDVLSDDDRLLLAAGSAITGPFLERLSNYRKLVGIQEPIKVKRFVPKSVVSTAPEGMSLPH